MKNILFGLIAIGLFVLFGCGSFVDSSYKEDKLTEYQLLIQELKNRDSLAIKQSTKSITVAVEATNNDGENSNTSLIIGDENIINYLDSTGKHVLNDTLQLNIGEFLFPLKINDFITEFGEPESVELPDLDDPSPWGQFYEWNINSKNLRVIALGDDYNSDSPNYNAESRLFSISMLDPRLVIDIKMPLNTNLGMSVKDLEGKINNFLKRNKLWEINEIMKRDGGGNRIKDDNIFVIRKNFINWEYYLIFKTDGQKLIKISQCTFNPYYAD